MKATILYCDRCAAEGRGNVLATLIVWIRTSLGGRMTRLDACAEHFAMVVGQSAANGAAPPVTPKERIWTRRSKEREIYTRLLGFIAKHERFPFEDARAFLGTKANIHMVGKVLRMLMEDGELTRLKASIYQRPGFTMPEPANVEQAAKLVHKIVTTRPGIKTVSAAALCGIDRVWLWKETLELLREQKLVRTKGTKSAMRLFAM
jgi:hypothetical protein